MNLSTAAYIFKVLGTLKIPYFVWFLWQMKGPNLIMKFNARSGFGNFNFNECPSPIPLLHHN